MENEEVTQEATEEVTQEVTQEEQSLEETQAQTEEQAQEEPARKQTAQERINEITRLYRTEQRANVEKDRELESLRNPQVSDPNERPNLDNYDTVEEYEDDLYEWRYAKQEARRQDQQQNLQRQGEYSALIDSFEERAQEAQKTIPDYIEVVSQPLFTPIMRDVFLKSENKDLAYEMGKRPALATKIAKMPPQQQYLELGKFEARFESNSSSNAPAPLNTLDNGASRVTKKEQDMDAQEYLEHIRKEV